MATVNPIEVKGFEDLNKKLKQLDDKVKRNEVLKIIRRLAEPIVKAYAAELPVGTRDKKRSGYPTVYPKGTLSKSVKVDIVPASKSKGNPAIAIRPGKKGKWDGYYRFMVTKKGAMTAKEIKKGDSRAGINTVTEEAKNRAWKSTEGKTTQAAVDKTAAYVQKQIDRLSK